MGNFTIGDRIPSFTAFLENGTIITDQDFIGKKVILFFYGQDDTPTCTKEACSLRDSNEIFIKNGYTIFGISQDTQKKHAKFIDKYNLPYSLISDPGHEIIKTFGYYGPKVFMGKNVMGIYRTTIVTDTNGFITHIIDDVVSGKHADQLKEALNIV